MSWRPEVIADDSGEWVGNALRFATRREADAYLSELAANWTQVVKTRAVEVFEPVNCSWANGRVLNL